MIVILYNPLDGTTAATPNLGWPGFGSLPRLSKHMEISVSWPCRALVNTPVLRSVRSVLIYVVVPLRWWCVYSPGVQLCHHLRDYNVTAWLFSQPWPHSNCQLTVSSPGMSAVHRGAVIRFGQSPGSLAWFHAVQLMPNREARLPCDRWTATVVRMECAW